MARARARSACPSTGRRSACSACSGCPSSRPGEIRFRLVQQILREGQKRGAVRFHVACADADDNVELFMQAGFARYGEEQIMYRPPDQALPEPWTEARAATSMIRA